MNDPTLLARKFGDLAKLAATASSDFERASVYAAAEAIAAAFLSESDMDGYTLENVERARWSICAAVGYDITNGHNQAQHVSWAIGAANTLESILENK